MIDLAGNCSGLNGLTIPITYGTIVPTTICQDTPHNGTTGWYGSAHACGTTVEVAAFCGVGGQNCSPFSVWNRAQACVRFTADSTGVSGCNTNLSSSLDMNPNIQSFTNTCDSVTYWSDTSPGGCQNGVALDTFGCNGQVGCCTANPTTSPANMKLVITP